MKMNVQPVPTLNERINEIRSLTAQIVNKEILPNESILWAWRTRRPLPGQRRATGAPPARGDQGEGQAGGPLGAAPARGVRRHGPRLPGARLHERGAGLAVGARRALRRRRPQLRQPDRSSSSTAPRSRRRSGSIPLIDGEMESGFSMTEPDAPGSDPHVDQDPAPSRRRRVGDQRPQVVHLQRPARGLRHRHVPHRGRRRRRRTATAKMTQIIVPTRHARLQHRPRHPGLGPRAATTARSSTKTCACPSRTSSDARAPGHQAAQDRLGAGRVFHCMNSVGQMWRAFDLMVERSIDARGARRHARDQAVHPGLHRRLLHRHPGRAADDDPLRRDDGQRSATRAPTSRRSRSSCRPPTSASSTARSRSGARPASRATCRSQAMYQGARTLRLADGPDEVHRS